MYYKRVVDQENLRIHSYETVDSIEKTQEGFLVYSHTMNGVKKQYEPAYVIIATGYYGQPNKLEIKGGTFLTFLITLKKLTLISAGCHGDRRKKFRRGRGSGSGKSRGVCNGSLQGKFFFRTRKTLDTPDFNALVRQEKIRLFPKRSLPPFPSNR